MDNQKDKNIQAEKADDEKKYRAAHWHFFKHGCAYTHDDRVDQPVAKRPYTR